MWMMRRRPDTGSEGQDMALKIITQRRWVRTKRGQSPASGCGLRNLAVPAQNSLLAQMFRRRKAARGPEENFDAGTVRKASRTAQSHPVGLGHARGQRGNDRRYPW